MTKGSVIRYVALPQITPRLQNLFAGGFGYIAFFIALVYQAVRLLPTNHPYTLPTNIGLFGIRHVVAEAANNLVLRTRNVDQIFLFATIMIGIIIVFIQIGLLAFTLMFQPALAALPSTLGGYFVTANPEHDIAFMMMDMVFGVEGLFKSCVSTAMSCGDGFALTESQNDPAYARDLNFPFPVHNGLHQLFQFYSSGLLVVAVMITSYFVVTVIAETAQTGTPFGKRFNKVWAPLRIVVAFGLLVPISNGMNSAQYIILHAAKIGSSFATNGWLLFNEQYLASYKEDTQRLVATPNLPEIRNLLQFMYIARTCAELETLAGRTVKPYLVRSQLSAVANKEIQPLKGGKGLKGRSDKSYKEMINFVGSARKAQIRFGTIYEERKNKDGSNQNETEADYQKYLGNVKPVCGDLVIPLKEFGVSTEDKDNEETSDTKITSQEHGAEILQRYYWYIWNEIWTGKGDIFTEYVTENGQTFLEEKEFPNFPLYLACESTLQKNNTDTCRAKLTAEEKKLENSYPHHQQAFYENDLRSAMVGPVDAIKNITNTNLTVIEAQDKNGKYLLEEEMGKRGWGGAAIWYNRIADMNGAVTSALYNIPYPKKYPEIMESVYSQKLRQQQKIPPAERFNPSVKSDKVKLNFDGDDRTKAETLFKAFSRWNADGTNTSTDNVIKEVMKLIFGVNGLFDMRANSDVHPVASLSSIGRALVESTIQNIGAAGLITGGGAALSVSKSLFGLGLDTAAAPALGKFLITIATIGLTVGFLLYYVLPFMPFIYFFFAVSGWIKGIFEAMVAAPLWALAHIRIDSEGLPGEAGLTGYFLVFEIFLRPILIVFGFLASILTFSAMISTLNETFDLVIGSVGGSGSTEFITDEDANILNPDTYRGPVDDFFYTVVYAIIAYLMANSSFKLVDLIPNGILRWMGSAAKGYNDQQDSPAEGLTQTVSVGGQQSMQAFGQGLQKAVEIPGKAGDALK